MKRWMAVACMLTCGTVAASPKSLAEWTEPVTGTVFVALPKGCFQMGASAPIAPPADSQWERIGYQGNLADDEVPRHEVCIDPIWIAKTEVSETDWHKVMGGAAPADGGKRAKVNVTWLQAREFAERLGAQSGGKLSFRLPTEAEWEYACRGGASDNPAPALEHLADKAWYAQSHRRSYDAREVGALKANAFGLYDMLGNAWEWTEDSYLANGYAQHALFNPKIETAGAPRVIRGGSFRTELAQTRCALRGRYHPGATLPSIGLRLVRQF